MLSGYLVRTFRVGRGSVAIWFFGCLPFRGSKIYYSQWNLTTFSLCCSWYNSSADRNPDFSFTKAKRCFELAWDQKGSIFPQIDLILEW